MIKLLRIQSFSMVSLPIYSRMKSSYIARCLVSLLFVYLLGMNTIAEAADVRSTWGGKTACWSIPTNWVNSPVTSNYPNNGNGGYTYDVVIGGGSCSLDVDATVNDFTFSGGYLNSSNRLVISGATLWTSGQWLSGGWYKDPGTNIFTGPLTIRTKTSGFCNFGYGTFLLPSTTVISNGTVYGSYNTDVINGTNGIVNIQDDSSLRVYESNALFRNDGLFFKSGASTNVSAEGVGVSTLNWTMTNNGTIRVDAGTLNLAGGGLLSGIVTSAPSTRLIINGNYKVSAGLYTPGILQFANGTSTLLSNYVFDATAVYLTGGAGGSLVSAFDTTFNCPVFWDHGSLQGPGTFKCNYPLTIDGANTFYCDEVRSGTLFLKSGAVLTNGTTYGSDGVIINDSGSTFDIRDDSSIHVNNHGALFINNGLLVKSGASTNVSADGVGVSTINWTMTNNGTIRVDAGTLNLAGGGLLSGIVTSAPSTRLIINGSYRVNAELYAPGVLQFGNGTSMLLSNYVFDATAVYLTGGAGGRLVSSFDTTFNCPVVWDHGSLQGPGTFTCNYPLTIDGANTFYADEVRSGTLFLKSGAVLTNGTTYGSAGVILNDFGSTFDIRDDSSIHVYDYGALFVNNGYLVKSGASNNVSGEGVGVSTINWTMTNNGTIRVDAGTLKLTNVKQTGGRTWLNGGSLAVPNGFTMYGGSLNGSGSILGALNNVSGSVSPGSSIGYLNVSGNYTQGGSAVLSVELGRSGATLISDSLVVSGTANLKGKIEVTLAGDAEPSFGDRFVILSANKVVCGVDSTNLPALSGGKQITVFSSTTNVWLCVGVAGDADGDNLSDQWELTYFGNLTRSDGGMSDQDGDGFPDTSEWLANTCPTNSSSYLRIEDVRSLGFRSIVGFNSQTDVIYCLESATNLSVSPLMWATSAWFNGTGGYVSLTNYVDGQGVKFYRLKANREQ